MRRQLSKMIAHDPAIAIDPSKFLVRSTAFHVMYRIVSTDLCSPLAVAVRAMHMSGKCGFVSVCQCCCPNGVLCLQNPRSSPKCTSEYCTGMQPAMDWTPVNMLEPVYTDSLLTLFDSTNSWRRPPTYPLLPSVNLDSTSRVAAFTVRLDSILRKCLVATLVTLIPACPHAGKRRNPGCDCAVLDV